jgi:hypothetical protein
MVLSQRHKVTTFGRQFGCHICFGFNDIIAALNPKCLILLSNDFVRQLNSTFFIYERILPMNVIKTLPPHLPLFTSPGTTAIYPQMTRRRCSTLPGISDRIGVSFPPIADVGGLYVCILCCL